MARENACSLPQRKHLLSLSPSLVNMTKPYLTVATQQLDLHVSLLLGLASLLSPATVAHGPRVAPLFDSPTISEDTAAKFGKDSLESGKSESESSINGSESGQNGPDGVIKAPPRKKLVSFRAQPDLAPELLSVSEDDEDVNSDTSSQFSFIQDRKGGRNTSVKYYKKVKPQSDVAQTNTFNERDLGYEVDDFSDYDFENNGLDDEDAFDDNDVQYNNVLFDDEAPDVPSNYNDNDLLHADGVLDDASFGHGDSRELFQELNTLVEKKNAASNENKGVPKHPFGGELEKSGPLGTLKALNSAGGPPITPPTNVVYSFPHEETASSLADGMSGSSNGDNVLLPTTEEEFNFNTDTSRQAPQYQLPEDALKNYRKYNKSYHLLIQGPVSPDEGYSDGNESVNEDDILENYLEFSKLPSAAHSGSSVDAGGKTPEPSTAEQLQLYDLNSPIINGLTIGQNLRHRMRFPDDRNRPYEADSAQNKVFIHRSVAKSSDGTGGWRPRRSEQEVFKMRSVKSFHSSLSEDLEAKISKTLAEYDDFNFTEKSQTSVEEENESTDSNATATGLGIVAGPDDTHPENRSIASKSTAATQTSRLSIHEMMNLLGSLESITPAYSVEAPKLEEASEVKRKSILGMMSLLANLEAGESTKKAKDEPDKEKRKSIVDMMSSLAALEANIGTSEEKNKRNSISNMMATLAKLDEENSQSASPEVKPADDTQKPASRISKKDPIFRLKVSNSDDVKRYSWSNNDETLAFKKADGAEKQSVSGEEGNENFNFDDVLDEINQMPEDFDFEEHEYRKKSLGAKDGFYRSNSYNKQPKKNVIDNTYATNKIETLNKTVTFYRSNSSGQSSTMSKSESVSRAPSTRSITSFTSVNEEAEAEEEEELSEQQEVTPLSERWVDGGVPGRKMSPFYEKGSDFKTAANLGTIKEADSPFLR